MVNNSVIELMLKHQSIRKFTQQTIPQALVEQLIQAGQAASSSSFVQVTTVIQVSRPELREKLQTASGNQAYVGSCPLFLVFCADLKRNQQICAARGVDMPTGFTEQALIASIDTAIMAQNVLLAAESAGLGGVYIGGLRNQPELVSETLNLPDQVVALFGMCLGYAAQDPGLKPRLPTKVVLHQEQYQPLAQTELEQYDQLLSAYYTQRTMGKLNTSFSEHIEKTLNKEARPYLLSYLQRQGLMTR
ncbi:MAG: oxygen-insensitive NADPH nitroreductase [Gammaproteobacteria bacterium]|jgi:nitroreductase|nr:oxygen-insensitive NADPH nitroreductase [Gammaproteobacteria bacterium]